MARARLGAANNTVGKNGPIDVPASPQPRPPVSFRDAQTALAMLDADLCIVETNPMFEAIAGKSSDDLVGIRVTDLWRVEEPGGPSLKVRLKQEQSVTVDALPMDPDSGLEAASFMFIEQSDIESFAGQIACVLVPTDNLHRQQELSMGGAGFQLSFEQVDVGMVIFGMDGAITDINEAMCRILGRTRAEVGTVDSNYVHPEDRLAAMEAGIQALSGEIDAWKLEKRIFHSDGHIVWVLESTTLVRDEDGNPLHFLAQFVDISDRKAAEEELRVSEAAVKFLADGLPVAVIEFTEDGTVCGGNAPLAELLGCDPIGCTFDDLVHEDDVEWVKRSFRGSLDDGSDWHVEFRIDRPDGALSWIRAHTRTHLGPDGRFSKAIATWADITDEVDAREASERFAELLEAVEDVVAITDPEGLVLHVNQAGRSLAVGRPMPGPLTLSGLFPSIGSRQIVDTAVEVAAANGRWSGEVTMDRPGEPDKILSLSLVAHVKERGGVQFLSAITRDITELKLAQERMRHQASTDALTGLPNRTILFDRLTHALARVARYGGGVGVLFIDLDRFKPVNDEYGHEAGDEVLVEVGARLLLSVRESDTVARIGGDEFVAVCEPLLRHDDALIVAERVVRNLSEPFEMPFGTVSISASVGLAMSAQACTPKSLVRDADLAAYRAKARGRSQVVVA